MKKTHKLMFRPGTSPTKLPCNTIRVGYKHLGVYSIGDIVEFYEEDGRPYGKVKTGEAEINGLSFYNSFGSIAAPELHYIIKENHSGLNGRELRNVLIKIYGEALNWRPLTVISFQCLDPMA